MAPAASIPAANLPILPLAKGTVLYPGSVLRVPVPPSRSDVPALLSTVYTRASKSQLRVDQVPIICVPLSSPLVTRRNQNLFEENPNKYNELLEANAKNVKKERLYGYGVQAKINAIQGQSDAEFSLVVQGIARVIIEKVTQDQPFFEAKIVPHVDQIGADELANTTFRELFGKLKSCSRDLVAYLRVSAFLVASGSQGLNPLLSRRLEQFIASKHLNEAGALADFMMNVVEATYEEKLEILSAIDVAVRMEKVIALIEKQVSDIKSNIKITTVTSTSIPIRIDPDDADKMPRGKSRRRTLPVGSQAFNVGSLFGAGSNNNSEKEDSDEPDELQELEKRLEAAKLTPEADKVAQRELKRLKQMVPAQAEYQVVRTYLETLAEIPWTAITDDPIDAGSLERARKQLDEDHYGIDKVKKRLLSYLTIVRLMQNANKAIDAQVKEAEQETTALESTKKDSAPKDTPADGDLEEKIRESGLKVQMLRGKLRTERAPILLLIGPPGVGKTSIARSIATALGRKFHRISLGGVRDEAEIRGHRRTYVAAMPGLIVQGLRKVGVANPVFLLDEIDKLGMANHNGDPSAAMLEVLDPEQNHNFSDHYVGTPIDLSKILFIATANSLDTIPGPLLDRMETLEFSGYTSLEKQHIAMRHLVPKQIRVNGLAEDQIRFNDQVVSKIIESYTREAGVRNLEREIGSVCRAKAVEYVEAGDSGKPDSFRADVTVEDLESILGIERFEDEIAETKSQPGIVTGLVAYSTGGNGGILFIEVLDMPGDGSVELTGNLGEVLKESVKVARSWVRNHAYELGLTQNPTENIMKNRSLHVHCPSGAVPKDGPSSGMAQAIALISLLSGRPVPATMAMTGEFQLSGHVKRVGGIKEKVIGAYRAGVKTVMLPAQNEKDTREVPQEVRDGLKIIYVGHIWEAIRHIWPEVTWPASGENGRDGSERPAQSRL